MEWNGTKVPQAKAHKKQEILIRKWKKNTAG
jgi:hypothetical protein